MIITYLNQNGFPSEILTSENKNLLQDSIWIDLLNPTNDEEKLIETMLELDIPTKKEMREIEFSSRLYKENEALFMTVTMIAKSETSAPKSDAVTLILAHNKLITIRYIEPQAFALFISRLNKLAFKNHQATQLFIELLETSIDRLADVLEDVSHHLDDYSSRIFRPKKIERQQKKPDYKQHFQHIGANGELGAKIQESLVTFNRLIMFYQQASHEKLDTESIERLTTLIKDIRSLRDYAGFLSSKVNFLLDATLGMVNIEQNNVIKIFSIAAVILLPPTLVASIYGMNFQFMPELSWRWGYPFSVFLMVFSAWLPYKYFKRKGWL